MESPSRSGAQSSAAPSDRIEAASAETAASVPSSKEALEAVSRLKKQKSTAVGIGVNVLTLVAVVFAFVVIMVRMTKDAPKSVSPFQGGPPPSMGGSGGGSGSAGAEAAAPVVGTVRLAEALAGQDPRGTLFITLRPSGAPPVGPPLAVQRLEAPRLPATFRVGPENVMLQGMPFTGPFDVYARLDGDGNAMTKDPTDLEAPPVRGVAPGADVTLVLGGPAESARPAPSPTEPPAPPPASAGGGLRGEVRVTPSLQGASGRGTLYIMVRNAGVPGPPVAVKKIADPRFPLSFEVGPADVMMAGTPLVGPFDLSARLDQDGDPMTKAAGDLISKRGLTGVPVGAADLVLELDEQL